VYVNHIDALKQQLERTPRPFPTLSFKREVASIDEFTFEDFQLHGYQPLEAIKMQMAV
jgi:thymidylate synthase